MNQRETFLGRPVRSLQEMLRLISKVNREIPPVIPDGIYGENTMRAVTALQHSTGLPATGVADFATWEQVLALYEEASEQLQPPKPLEIRMPPGAAILPNEEHYHLHLVQAMFRALSTVYENVPPVELTGVHDEACVRAVCWLQELSGLPMTGELDRKTWRYLTGLYRLADMDAQT